MSNPKTRNEWQEAVDLASFYTHLQSAVDYGLVASSIEIDMPRCEQVIKGGAQRGIYPTPGCVERIARQLASRSDAPGGGVCECHAG